MTFTDPQLPSEHAMRVLIQTARECIRTPVARAVRFVRTGEREVQDRVNPFTGKREYAHVPKEVEEFARVARQRGLHEDTEFQAALESLLKHIGEGPVFKLFAAFDGEGGWARELALAIHLSSGEVIPYLHEVLFPIDEDLSLDVGDTA